MGWFLTCLVNVAIFAGMVYGVGSAIRAGVGRNSPDRHRQGKYVLRGALAGVLIGGCVGLVRAFDDHGQYFHEYGGGFMGFGLILGVGAGNSYGATIADGNESSAPHG